MKKKNILSLLILVIALLAFPVKAYADHSDTARVVDNADILSEDEKTEIEETLTQASLNTDMDIVLFFESASPDEYVDEHDDECAMYYCADLYDYGGYTDNGLALLVTVDERKWALVTEGTGDDVFNGSVQSSISNEILPYLKKSDFSGAARAYADYIYNNFTDTYETEDTDFWADDETYIYPVEGEDDGESFNQLAFCWEMADKPFIFLVSLAIGLIAALIRTFILKAKLVSVKSDDYAANYVVEDSLKLRTEMNTYLYTTETRVRKSSDNDDNSSSFTSDSGDDHTGSTGDF